MTDSFVRSGCRYRQCANLASVTYGNAPATRHFQNPGRQIALSSIFETDGCNTDSLGAGSNGQCGSIPSSLSVACAGQHLDSAGVIGKSADGESSNRTKHELRPNLLAGACLVRHTERFTKSPTPAFAPADQPPTRLSL